MHIIIILFFLSLLGIIVMIGKKIVLLRNNKLTTENNFSIQIPNLQEIGHLTVKNSRKYGYILLVKSVRSYVLSVNFLKNKYLEIKKSTKKYIPNKKLKSIEKKDSKFLKVISDYKHKIKRIKDKIEEEEGIQQNNKLE